MELIINLISRIEVAKANVKTIVECYLSSKYRYPLDSNVVCPWQYFSLFCFIQKFT